MSKTTFAGKVAVVTGAGSGIGRALALGLARHGARLALSDVNEAALAESADLVNRIGTDVHTHRLDVSDRPAFVAYAKTVAKHFGVVHQIYNNAGVGLSRSILESGYEEYERVLGINLWGVITGTKEFLPHLIASGDGHVVNIASLNGIMAYPSSSQYVTSKFAVRGFTDTLLIEMLVENHPVTVTGVFPGGIKTNITVNARQFSRDLGIPVDAKRIERGTKYTEKYLTLSPDIAARIILKGVAARRTRVLVGRDAWTFDKIVRLLPSLYPRIVASRTRGANV